MISSPWSVHAKQLRTLLLDLFFPVECLGCRQAGVLACQHCLDLVPLLDSQVCPWCKVPFQPHGQTCTKCRGKTSLDGLFVARPYRFRLVEQLIHTLKYRLLQTATLPLVDLIETSLAQHALPLPDLLIPVPLHPRRLRYRGFNQADLIAQELARRLMPGLSIPVDGTHLRRTRFTKPQMKTESRDERLRNLSGAFTLDPTVAGPLVGTYVWLIDDVATTGTTLDECARVLKAAGVKKVWGVVVAR